MAARRAPKVQEHQPKSGYYLVTCEYNSHRLYAHYFKMLKGSSGGVVVKLLACLARGQGFEHGSRHSGLATRISDRFESRYDLSNIKVS